MPVCKNRFEKSARIFSRRHKQTTFSDAVFLGALRVKELLGRWGENVRDVIGFIMFMIRFIMFMIGFIMFMIRFIMFMIRFNQKLSYFVLFRATTAAAITKESESGDPLEIALRKHAYIILTPSSPLLYSKTQKLKNIDCWYSLAPPQ